MTTHCTNYSCKERDKCKKGKPTQDGDTPLYLFPRAVFEACEHFECLECRYHFVHGNTKKQCGKCGKVEFDGVEYNVAHDCIWAQHGDVRNA